MKLSEWLRQWQLTGEVPDDGGPEGCRFWFKDAGTVLGMPLYIETTKEEAQRIWREANGVN